jgi:hypothetical protein
MFLYARLDKSVPMSLPLHEGALLVVFNEARVTSNIARKKGGEPSSYMFACQGIASKIGSKRVQTTIPD